MVFEQSSAPQLSADPSTNPSSSADWLLRHYELSMATAEANKDYYRQWVWFKYFINRLLVRMDVDTQETLEKEFAAIHQMEYEIETTIENPDNQTVAKEALWRNFMKSHTAYAYLTLARAGETTITENAELDFSKLNYESVRKIVSIAHDGKEEAVRAGEALNELPE